MGQPVPPDWPEIENDKFYIATVQHHAFDPINPDSCHGAPDRQSNACILGSGINAWIQQNHQCTIHSLIYGAGSIDQRLISAVGPFDTFAICEAART